MTASRGIYRQPTGVILEDAFRMSSEFIEVLWGTESADVRSTAETRMTWTCGVLRK
jgi:hypothetical protein